MAKQLIYRVFQEPGGFYFCDNDLAYLDARGTCYPDEPSATAAACRTGQQREEHEDVEFVGVTGSGVDRETAGQMGCDVID